MRFYISLMLFLGFYHVSSHDIRMAYFEIRAEQSSYKMNVRYDRMDLLRELGSYGDLNQAVQKYLDANLSLLFDGELVSWKVEEVELTELFIEVSCSIETSKKNITTINIWNTSLINSVEKHDNVIVSRLHGKTRSFRLNKERQETTIKY